MKILLIGEYSRLHNSLKEGLQALGHEVLLVASGDNFKKYDVDYSLHSAFVSDFWFIQRVKNGIFKITTIDLEKIERAIRFYSFILKQKEFDHVQFINSDAIESYPFLSRILYKKLFKTIKSRSLLICGDETPVVDYLLQQKMKYSILSPYFEEKSLEKQLQFTLKYRTKSYRKTFDSLYKNCTSFITSDLDYKIPMEAMGYHSHFIPNPINTDTIEYKPLVIEDKIIIFLGINNRSAVKKGSHFFEKAVEIITEKYPNQVEIIVTRSIPYKQYIGAYNKAHILLDQVYSYDQGYNALEAMAKGKVVFTGAENEFMKQYYLTEKVAINALPNVKSLVEELSFLIENPEELKAISKRARAFVEQEHNYSKIAEKYLEVWSQISNKN
ncbi:glycosyltransferase family protein [Flavobacterium nackdongense]|uniref:Glycosyltransferase n=1 Tax=Flavobacterium nackdongense TaxID=2547394 RepID=A0A4P6YCS2_9FLAO|nr:glycosyltransferase [Flavobacterium nackdongense]QBN20068.1 glycosyltransferase [Flavobacterium nackdongense]